MPTLTLFRGRNAQKAPTEIHDLEATILRNLFISGHSLMLREGKTTELTDAGTLWGLHRAYIEGVSPFWLWSRDNLVRSNRTGSNVTIKTLSQSNLGVGFVAANGVIYILPANTTDAVQKSIGTAAGTSDHPDADCPKASLGLWKHNRLFLNDLNNFDRIWFSSTNDPDTFINQSSSAVATDGGWISFNKGDGDRIKGLAELGSTIFVFKERSIYMLIGTSFVGDETFRIIPLFRGIGTKSPRSIVPVENGLMFLDSERLIRYFHGPSRTLVTAIGKPIEDVTRAIPNARIEDAAATFHNRRYLLSCAGAGGTLNNQIWVCDLRFVPSFSDTDNPDFTSLWSEITGWGGWNVALVANGPSDDGSFFFADSFAVGRILKGLTTLSDDGAAIAYEWRTKAYGTDAPTTINSLSEFITVTRNASAAVTGAISHLVYIDLADTTAASQALSPSSTAHSVNIWRPGEAARGVTLQVGVSGSSTVGFEMLSAGWEWHGKRGEKVDA